MDKVKELFTAENVKKGLKWFFFSFIWLAILMFIIDIVSKQLIMANFQPGGLEHIWLIPNFLSITYVQNDGMAFGIDTGNKIANIILFVSVSVIGTILILYFLIKYWKKQGLVFRAAMMLMLSGTIGNLIDRAFYYTEEGVHFVVDFIHFRFGTYDFPVFNIADSCLVIGVIILIIWMIILEVKENKAKQVEIATVKENVNDNKTEVVNEPSLDEKEVKTNETKIEIENENEPRKD